MIVTLFSLMLSCGIPQLRTENGEQLSAAFLSLVPFKDVTKLTIAYRAGVCVHVIVHFIVHVIDLDWLSTTLRVNDTEEEAAQHFRALITEAMNTVTTRLNDAAHLLRR